MQTWLDDELPLAHRWFDSVGDWRELARPTEEFRDDWAVQHRVYRVLDADRDRATLALRVVRPVTNSPFNDMPGTPAGSAIACVRIVRSTWTDRSGEPIECPSGMPRDASAFSDRSTSWGRDVFAVDAAEAAMKRAREAAAWLLSTSNKPQGPVPHTKSQVIATLRNSATELPSGVTLSVQPTEPSADLVTADLVAVATARDFADPDREITIRLCGEFQADLAEASSARMAVVTCPDSG